MWLSNILAYSQYSSIVFDKKALFVLFWMKRKIKRGKNEENSFDEWSEYDSMNMIINKFSMDFFVTNECRTLLIRFTLNSPKTLKYYFIDTHQNIVITIHSQYNSIILGFSFPSECISFLFSFLLLLSSKRCSMTMPMLITCFCLVWIEVKCSSASRISLRIRTTYISVVG